MPSYYADIAVTNECAAAPETDERPTHTVRVTAAGLEVDGALVHPDFYDLVGGENGTEVHMRFTRVVTITDRAPEAETAAAPPEPQQARGYVQLLIKADTVQDGARQVNAFCAALSDSIKVHADIQIR